MINKAILMGRIQSCNWQDQNGNKRTSIEVRADEINFGETKKSREGGGQPGYSIPSSGSDFAELGDDDGDVPF